MNVGKCKLLRWRNFGGREVLKLRLNIEDMGRMNEFQYLSSMVLLGGGGRQGVDINRAQVER